MAKENENGKLDFEDAKDLTVQEALRKHKEIEAGVTDDDGVLDKYIKQHRDQVVAEKYETQTSDFENIDTSSLDSFIQKQREELANQGLLAKDEEISEASETSQESSEKQTEDEFVDETRVFAPVKNDDLKSDIDLAIEEEEPSSPVESVAEDEEAVDDLAPSKKHRSLIIGSLVALLVLILGIGFGINHWTKQSRTAVSSKAPSKSEKSGTSDYQAFEKLYKAFFIDKKRTQLKNSQFSKLSDLNISLKKLEGTSYYKTAKSDYNSLNKQITAIQTVNKLFEKAVIVDGKLVSDAKAKKDADFDKLTDDTLKTGNATLDKLIQEAIAKGKAQQETDKSSSSNEASSDDNSDNAGGDTNAGSSANTGAIPSGGNIRQAGITNYDPGTLQRDRSRVPYDAAKVQDVNNSAWVFGDGILEKVVSTSQSRGYFSGDDYILEPVNIINGNGYYNMYKSDGTYLFSINCKTGYFFGNASGRPTDF
ncbi:cell division site-positioning protein MapZ family protein [Streptococcus dentasini]